MIESIALDWLLGKNALKAGLKNKWIKGKIRTGVKQRIFNVKWQEVIERINKTDKTDLFLAASSSSTSFLESMRNAMELDWIPPKDLLFEAVWQELEEKFNSKNDLPIDIENKLKASQNRISNAFKEDIRNNVLDKQVEYREWYINFVSSFYDSLHKAYQDNIWINDENSQIVYLLHKQEREISSVKDLCKTIIILVVIFVFLSLGADAFDYMSDKILDTPFINNIFAITGTSVAGILKWAIEGAKKLPKYN